jgi:capsular exopolysaccharide synthesis family protein
MTPIEPVALPSESSSIREIRTICLRVPAPSPLLPFENGHGRPSEQYRILRTKIVQHPNQPHLILVSSPASGDGKSTTATNTAAALSLKSDAHVLLLDADFRKSAIHIQLGLPEAPGLSEVLSGASRIEDALVRTEEFPNLFVISAGVPPPNPVELLDSPSWQAFCNKIRSLFRYVVLDSPPVGAVADYDLVQAVCDGVVLVVRPDHTNRRLYETALKIVPKTKFLGMVLNCVPDWSLAQHGGSDYYYSAEKIYQDSPPGSAAGTTAR